MFGGKTMPTGKRIRVTFGLIASLAFGALATIAQTTSFTYQGKLTDSNNPANGPYEMTFSLFDAPNSGTQIGSTITNPTVTVAGGIFTVNLDFGLPAFSGAARYLEIGVRPVGNPNPYTILAPRQLLSSAPYGVRSMNAANADLAAD